MMSEVIRAKVTKIYPPEGNKPGGLMVDHTYTRLTVWPKDLPNFQEGCDYEIPVFNKPYNGKDQWSVGKGGIKKVGGFEQTSAPTQSSSSPMDDGTQLKIWTQGVLQACITGGLVTSINEIPQAAIAIMGMYDGVFNNPMNQSARDLDDPIPF